jgi:hypothetical protein
MAAYRECCSGSVDVINLIIIKVNKEELDRKNIK